MLYLAAQKLTSAGKLDDISVVAALCVKNEG